MRGAKSRLSGRRQCARHSGIGGIKNAGRRAGKYHGLLAGNESGDLIVFFVPGLDAVPSQTVIQREVARHAPAILRIEADIFVAAVKGLQLALVVLAGNSRAGNPRSQSPVSVPKNRKLPLNCAMAFTLT